MRPYNAVQQDNLIGTTLGDYRILAPLGQGGMARVYTAHQEKLDRSVAVKILPPWYAADRNFVERFKLEAKLVAGLSHPNIVTVHDFGEQNGHLYIVMQLVDGGTLKNRLDDLQTQRRTMDVLEANRLFQQLADALGYAHKRGIIHRDVKPVNVLIDHLDRPILSDFGIAKALAVTTDQLTRPGAGVGTPEYMSPEQCQGSPVDGRADIYALGVMLFEALTGRTPFVADNYPALAHSHIYVPPPPPSRFNPQIDPTIEQVILTALRKSPSERYQQAGDLSKALEKAINSLPPARPYVCEREQHPNKPIDLYCTKCGIPLNVCLSCGNLNPVKEHFCSRCHALLNRCFKCGKQNVATNKFCIRCGSALPAARTQ